MVPQLVVLALEFHRAPLRFGHLTDPALEIPDAFAAWLSESGNALAPANIQHTAESLTARPEELREAFLFFLRQTLLLPQADHYRVLGLPRGCSGEAIKRHHSLLVRLFHPDRMPGNEERSIALTARINAAYQTLRDPQARKRYDSELRRPPYRTRSQADKGDFFRPRDPIAGSGASARRLRALPVRARSGVLWTLAAVSSLALFWLAIREPGEPTLRVNPELAREMASGPSFLQGATEEAGSQAKAEDRPTDHASSALVAEARVAAPGAPTLNAADMGEAVPREVAPSAEEGPQALLPHSGGDGSGAPPIPIAPPVSRAAKSMAASTAAIQPAPPQPVRTESSRVSPPAGKAPLDAADDAPEPNEAPAPPPKTQATRPEKKVPESAGPDFAPVAEGPHQEPLASAAAIPASDPSAHAPGASGKQTPTTQKEPKDRASASRHPAAEAFVGRLERAYASGDLSGLVSLFTANAVVNGRVGSAAVRKAYTDSVPGGGKRRLSISNLRWRTSDDQRLVATGAVRLGTKSGFLSGWNYATGTIELELVPWMGDYKVARMTQRISPE
jgi:hypothetical protein